MNELPNRVHVDSGSASGIAGGVWRVAGGIKWKVRTWRFIRKGGLLIKIHHLCVSFAISNRGRMKKDCRVGKRGKQRQIVWTDLAIKKFLVPETRG